MIEKGRRSDITNLSLNDEEKTSLTLPTLKPKRLGYQGCCCCLLLFLTFSALVANPKKLLYTVANLARGLLNREKKKEKKKVWQRPPPPPTSPRAARSEKNKKIKITRRIHMSRRYEGRRYAGGLGPSRVRTRIPTTRRLGQWVSLR